jgi:trk system potassium uptake protein TrkH
MWSELNLDFTHAFFEATSGITTTGGTVIVGLDNLPPGILLWRAILHFYGGIGVIVIAIAVLPMLRIGGMQLFRAESSDRSEKIFPAAATIAGSIFGVYLALNFACAIAYMLAGMTPFDAMVHGMSTVAAGGFAAYDASLAYFQNPAVDWIAIIFMLGASLPFVMYIHAIRGRPDRLYRSSEVRLFLAIALTATLLLWVYLELRGIAQGETAIRLSAFHVVSIISTTGLATQDYATWGPFSDVLFILLMLIGGCTGSPAGGIKVLRFLIIGKAIAQQMRRMLYPNGMFPLVFEGHPLGDDVVRSVTIFVIFYLLVLGLLTLGVSSTDLDFRTAFSAVAANLSNAGPGLGPVIGPVGNYSSLSDFALWQLSLAMLLGRLEIFTILILFLPRFWRP